MRDPSIKNPSTLQGKIEVVRQAQPRASEQITSRHVAGPVLPQINPRWASESDHQGDATQYNFLPQRLSLEKLRDEHKEPSPPRKSSCRMPAGKTRAAFLPGDVNQQWSW